MTESHKIFSALERVVSNHDQSKNRISDLEAERDQQYQANVELIIRIGQLETEVAKLQAMCWMAWREFNAISARSGAPIDRYGMSTCDHAYWTKMTAALAQAGGSTLPWPATAEMSAYIDQALQECADE